MTRRRLGAQAGRGCATVAQLEPAAMYLLAENEDAKRTFKNDNLVAFGLPRPAISLQRRKWWIRRSRRPVLRLALLAGRLFLCDDGSGDKLVAFAIIEK